MSGFADRAMLVTGASSGIGRACAVKLASEGARLALIGRNAERLNETMSMLGGNDHTSLTVDLNDEQAMVGAMDGLHATFPPFRGVVHCAGTHWLRPLQMVSRATLMEMLGSHVGSSILLARTLVTSRMLSKEGASIVWLSSAAA